MNIKKWIGAAVGVILFFAVCTIHIYGVSDDITTREIQSPNTLQNRQSIATKILTATGRQEAFLPQEATDVAIYYGDLTGDGTNEAIIAVEFGPKNTIVAAYTPTEGGYTYLGDVGEFFYVRSIEFLNVADLNRDIMLITEYANQDIGAFERSSFIRGYSWDNNMFRQVLKVPEGIESIWNELWDNKTQNGQNEWHKIEQRTDITFENGGHPVLNLVHYQAHKISPNDQKEAPPADTYDTVANRVVTETQKWNDEWDRFILSEATETATGQTVAVIEDFGASPYALLDDFAQNANKVRIERKDGSQQIVDKTALTGYSNESQQAFQSFQ